MHHLRYISYFSALVILLAVPTGAFMAERPSVNTGVFAPNYHYFTDTDDRITLSGSNFGSVLGQLIRLDNNKEIVTREYSGGPAWSDDKINFFPSDNADVLSVGLNEIIVRTAEGLESDPFTINFEKYWIGPHIFSISPSTIYLGDEIEIIGENFGDTPPPEDCPADPPNPFVPCGVLDGANQLQRTVSWSDTKIRAIVDNTVVENNRGIRVVVHKFISNPEDILGYDRTRGSNSVSIDVLQPICTADTWSCSDWSVCSIDTQTRSCQKTFDCLVAVTPLPDVSQSCTPPSPEPDVTPPVLTPVNLASTHPEQPSLATAGDTVNLTFTANEPLYWFAVNWTIGGEAATLPGGNINLQGNTWEAHLHVQAEDPNGTVGFTIDYQDFALNSGTIVTTTTDGSFVTVNNVTACTSSDWTCGTWSACSSGGQQARICTKIGICEGGVTPDTEQSCSSSQPTCTEINYSDWGVCSGGWQFRSIVSTVPSSCVGGDPVLSQPCLAQCTDSAIGSAGHGRHVPILGIKHEPVRRSVSVKVEKFRL